MISKGVLAFLFGLGSITEIRIVGTMGITELVCILFAPYLFLSHYRRLRQTYLWNVLMLMFLWFASAAITDIYRETVLQNAVKGCVAILFLAGVTVVCFYLLWEDINNVKWMVAGMMLSAVISIYSFGSASLLAKAQQLGTTIYEIQNFRTKYAGVIMYGILLLSIVLYKKRPILVSCIFAVSSVAYLYYGSRNGFLSLFISTIVAWTFVGSEHLLRVVQKRTAISIMIASALIYASYELYTYAIASGYLGQEEIDRYYSQVNTSVGILQSRSHFVASTIAILDSPIIGHGSWPIDRNNYAYQMFRAIGDSDSLLQMRYGGSGTIQYIPTHSHLWQAWVWHGLLGAAFWMYIIYLIIRFYYSAMYLRTGFVAFMALLIMISTWDLLFSPFMSRPRWAMVFTLLCLYLHESSLRVRQRKEGLAPPKWTDWNGRWRDQ